LNWRTGALVTSCHRAKFAWKGDGVFPRLGAECRSLGVAETDMKRWFAASGWKWAVTVVQLAVLAALFVPILMGLEKPQVSSKRSAPERTAADAGHAPAAAVQAR
jgi:hypothetical protein